MTQKILSTALILLLPDSSFAGVPIRVDEPGIFGLLSIAAVLGLIATLRRKK